MQPETRPRTSISCNVIDRRTGTPAVGVRVLLRCLHEYPDYDKGTFEATTDQNGYILWWNSKNNSEMTLPQYLFDHQSYEQMCWQMRFHTADYFVPIQPYYTSADVCFILRRGEQAPNVTLYADVRGFGTWIEPFRPREIAPQPVQRPRQYFRLSYDQNKALTEHFVDEPYPSLQSYSKLSGDLNLRLDTTRAWFKRRRITQKQVLQNRRIQQSSVLAMGCGNSPGKEMGYGGLGQLEVISEEAESYKSEAGSLFSNSGVAMDFNSTSPADQATQSAETFLRNMELKYPAHLSGQSSDTVHPNTSEEPNKYHVDTTNNNKDTAVLHRLSHSSLDRILEATNEVNDGVSGIEGGVGGMTLVHCGGKVVRRSTRKAARR